MNSLIDAFSAAWRRSFDYSGRSSRGDYWWFVLDNFILSVVLLLLSNVASFFGSIYTLWAIASIVPSFSLLIRRLRDVGKGWPWIFIGLIPLIGGIWLIVLLAQPSLSV